MPLSARTNTHTNTQEHTWSMMRAVSECTRCFPCRGNSPKHAGIYEHTITRARACARTDNMQAFPQAFAQSTRRSCGTVDEDGGRTVRCFYMRASVCAQCSSIICWSTMALKRVCAVELQKEQRVRGRRSACMLA